MKNIFLILLFLASSNLFSQNNKLYSTPQYRKVSGEDYENFWKAQGEKMGDEMRFSFEELRRENQQFGGDYNQETHNREKPISQKTTHLLLYGGLSVVALWIILNEILQM